MCFLKTEERYSPVTGGGAAVGKRSARSPSSVQVPQVNVWVKRPNLHIAVHKSGSESWDQISRDRNGEHGGCTGLELMVGLVQEIREAWKELGETTVENSKLKVSVFNMTVSNQSGGSESDNTTVECWWR